MFGFEDLVRLFGARIVMLLGLIAADVILAVSESIKKGTFEWDKLADFYRTNIVPILLGWLAAAILARTIVTEWLPEELSMLGPGVDLFMFGVGVLHVGRSVLSHLKEIIIPDGV